MRTETYINAMVKAKTGDKFWLSDCVKRDRQYRAFRNRILKMDAEKDAKIAAANKMLSAVVVMKIDGWLSGEYNLPDQQCLINAALEYNSPINPDS